VAAETETAHAVTINDAPGQRSWEHRLPPLPYPPTALEPYIDSQTVALHHDGHHASYVAKLNSILEDYPELHDRTALWLTLNLAEVPESIRTAVQRNAGGHLNHSLFWRVLCPAAGGAPCGPLAIAIERDFGSIEQFKLQFTAACNGHFGSGWVWLARHEDGGKLEICTTSGHDNPMTQGYFPILVNDVWEHAYYLKYRNRRGDYLRAWWSIVNWEEAARRFRHSDQSAVRDWEGEGGLVL
jgi:Fe-Mn family superoxide dismutase